jgi:hypothetical protein
MPTGLDLEYLIRTGALSLDGRRRRRGSTLRAQVKATAFLAVALLLAFASAYALDRAGF